MNNTKENAKPNNEKIEKPDSTSLEKELTVYESKYKEAKLRLQSLEYEQTKLQNVLNEKNLKLSYLKENLSEKNCIDKDLSVKLTKIKSEVSQMNIMVPIYKLQISQLTEKQSENLALKPDDNQTKAEKNDLIKEQELLNTKKQYQNIIQKNQEYINDLLKRFATKEVE